MKNTLLFILFSLPFLTNAQLDCSKFKEGRFVYPDNEGFVTVRKGLKQKSYTNGKLMATWNVKWTGECSFTLTCKKINKEMKPFQKGDIVLCEIVRIEENCFDVKVGLERNGQSMMEPAIGEMCLE